METHARIFARELWPRSSRRGHRADSRSHDFRAPRPLPLCGGTFGEETAWPPPAKRLRRFGRPSIGPHTLLSEPNRRNAMMRGLAVYENEANSPQRRVWEYEFGSSQPPAPQMSHCDCRSSPAPISVGSLRRLCCCPNDHRDQAIPNVRSQITAFGSTTNPCHVHGKKSGWAASHPNALHRIPADCFRPSAKRRQKDSPSARADNRAFNWTRLIPGPATAPSNLEVRGWDTTDDRQDPAQAWSTPMCRWLRPLIVIAHRSPRSRHRPDFLASGWR